LRTQPSTPAGTRPAWTGAGLAGLAALVAAVLCLTTWHLYAAHLAAVKTPLEGDCAAYLKAARSLEAGNGPMTRDGTASPIVLWQPAGFPLLIAGLRKLGVPGIDAALLPVRLGNSLFL
jgi:hypothetical protein